MIHKSRFEHLKAVVERRDTRADRMLCDARTFNVFEGAAEIQARGIARGLLSGRN